MKRILFLSCLFVVLHSSSAFCSLSVGDYKQMEIEGKEPTWNEITQDQTSYENWLDYLSDKTNAHFDMPSFSQVADLTANLLAYSVGNYADVASGVLSDLEDTFSLGSDIWDFMTFNVQQMAFDYAPDFAEMMKSAVDDEIYTLSGGYWYSLPLRVKVSGTSEYYNFSIISGSGYIGFYTENGYHKVVAVSNDSGFKVQCIGGDNPSINCNIAYNGEKTSGFYRGSAVLARNYSFVDENGGSLYSFTSLNDAIVDYFGENPSFGGEELNGQGIIVNENPVINPVTLSSALGYPFAQTVINNYNNNTPIPWRPNNYNYVDYNYGYEVPFWEGYELETIAYPEEIEFPSVEFETVAVDTNIDTAIEGLSGWIIEFLLIAILLLVLGLII